MGAAFKFTYIFSLDLIANARKHLLFQTRNSSKGKGVGRDVDKWTVEAHMCIYIYIERLNNCVCICLYYFKRGPRSFSICFPSLNIVAKLFNDTHFIFKRKKADARPSKLLTGWALRIIGWFGSKVCWCIFFCIHLWIRAMCPFDCAGAQMLKCVLFFFFIPRLPFALMAEACYCDVVAYIYIYI